MSSDVEFAKGKAKKVRENQYASYSEHLEKQKKHSKFIKVALIGLPLLALGFVINNSVLMTDAGYTYVHQNNLTGELDVFTEPGVHFRMPFLSKITEYHQVITVSFGNQNSKLQEYLQSMQSLEPIQVRFADTYIGAIPVTYRFKLSSDPDAIKKMHREFRNNDNLVDSLLVKNARNVTVITATQYTGEEFFQGALNAFKSKLEDQLSDGIYLTERRQVEVEQVDLVPVGVNQSKSNQLQRSKQLVWKTVPVVDEKAQPIRQDNPMAQYGIQVTQVTIGEPIPEKLLDQLLTDKKRLVADRIRAIQEQETSKAQAETEQLRKEIERTRAVQDAQRSKELAIIAQQKEVEVARQIAQREIVEVEKTKQLAEVEKEKELAIAEANLAIQKANALSAKFEAQATLEKGHAAAEVLKAKYAALGANKEVYLAELKRDISNVMYQNLQNFKVEMPQNYIGGSNNAGLATNLDVITGFGALGMMDQTKKIVNQQQIANLE